MAFIQIKVTQNIDFSSPLFKRYRETYPGVLLHDRLQSSLKEFQTTRNAVVAMLKDTSDIKLIQATLEKWLMDAIFLQQHVTVALDIVQSFTWSNVFTNEFKTHRSWAFEIASVLFNLGIIYFTQGQSIKRTDAEQLRISLKFFEKAKMIFNHLLQFSVPHLSNVAVDFHPKMLTMLSLISQAQMESIIYEKGVLEDFNRSLLSKLAFSVATTFQNAFEETCNTTLEKIVPNNFVIWLKTQYYAYMSAAHFQRAKHDLIEVTKKSEGYGMIISRLSLTIKYCDQAFAESRKSSQIIVDLTKLKQQTTTLYNQLINDNNLIYLENVPPSTDLLPLEATPQAPPLNQIEATKLNDVSALKSMLSITYTVSEEIQSVFNEFIPAPILIAFSSIRARASALLLVHKKALEKIKNDLDTLLCNKDLLHLLESCTLEEKSENQVESAFVEILEVQNKGVISECMDLIEQLSKLSNICQEKLEIIEYKLRDEEESNEKYQKQYSTCWTLTPSRELNSRYFTALYDYKAAHKKAIETNSNFFAKLDETKNYHDLILSFKERSNDIVSTSNEAENDTKTSTKNQLTEKAKEILEKLEKANKIHYDLTNKLNKESIQWKRELMQTFAKKRDLQEEPDIYVSIFASHITSTSIEKDIRHIESLLIELRNLCSKNNTNQTPTSQIANTATNKFEKIKEAASTILKTHKNMKDGLTFFTTLSNYLSTFEDQVDQYVFQRKEETYENLKRIGISNDQIRNFIPVDAPYQQSTTSVNNMPQSSYNMPTSSYGTVAPFNNIPSQSCLAQPVYNMTQTYPCNPPSSTTQPNQMFIPASKTLPGTQGMPGNWNSNYQSSRYSLYSMPTNPVSGNQDYSQIPLNYNANQSVRPQNN